MKGRKKRTKYEIVHDILEVVGPGVKFLHIMYKANLSSEVAKKYIEKLKEKELIVQKDNLYFLTEKGIRLLDILKQYKQKKEELNNLLQDIVELYGE